MEDGQKICLGEIVGVHGIRGEVKVKSFTEKDRDLGNYGILEDQKGRSLEVKVVGHSKELLRVKVKGVDDRNVAMEMIGTRLYADRSVFPELKDEEEFYQADLIGLEVKLENSDKVVGKVSGIYDFGAGDILEIKLTVNGKSEMLPFSKAYVPVVNIKEGYIIVSSVSMVFEEDEEK